MNIYIYKLYILTFFYTLIEWIIKMQIFLNKKPPMIFLLNISSPICPLQPLPKTP